MVKPIGDILIRLSVLAMALLLALPCSLKGEFKTSLGIPLAETTMPRLVPVQCIWVAEDYLSMRATASVHKQLPLRFPEPVGVRPSQIEVGPGTILRYRRNVNAAVPIYILHECYLI